MVEHADRGSSTEFQVVVMGTGPVGKTSLINALLGRSVGEIGATIGTTRGGRVHTHLVEGVEGVLLLTDTPGLGEAGHEGLGREVEAMDLATRADLVVFIVDHDLTRAACQTIFALARQGKRLIVALNKRDRFTEEDRDPVRERHPEYEGRWLAVFAPVEGTEMVVVVQQRDDDALATERSFFRRFLMWAAGLIGGAVIAVFAALRLARFRRAQTESRK